MLITVLGRLEAEGLRNQVQLDVHSKTLIFSNVLAIVCVHVVVLHSDNS